VAISVRLKPDTTYSVLVRAEFVSAGSAGSALIVITEVGLAGPIIACNAGSIRLFGNDVAVPSGPGRAWSPAGGACQDLGGNTYSGLPPQ
jgi:hypothetical protein